MERRGHILLIAFLLMGGFFLPAVSFGQDIDVPETPYVEDDKQVDIYDQNSHDGPETSKEVTPATHEESTAPAHHPVAVPQKKKAEPQQPNQKKKQQKNSILSYNFLYYMIQEFKLSDIVEE